MENYSLFLSSGDKVAGSNNNATFNIDWPNLLPDHIQYFKVSFNLVTCGGYYKDGSCNATSCNFNNIKVVVDFGGKSFSFDSKNASNSPTLGYAIRDIQTSTTSSNSFTTLGGWNNVKKTIARPNQQVLNVKLYCTQPNNVLLVDTNSGGTALSGDCTAWNMAIEFEPIEFIHTKSKTLNSY